MHNNKKQGKLYFIDVINLTRTRSCMVEVIISMEICCKFYNYTTAMHFTIHPSESFVLAYFLYNSHLGITFILIFVPI